MANPKKLAPPPPPPPASNSGKSPGAVYRAFINAHKAIKPYSESISKWATAYGLDPTYLAALLLHESQGDKNAANTNKNGTRDLGLAQINSIHFGKTITPWDGQTVTAEKALDPAFAIQFAAWYFGQKVAKAGGDYVAAYNGAGGYNPGGPDPFTGVVSKTYVPAGKGLSPEERAALAAQQAAANSAGKAVLFDRWAVLGADGRVKFVKITDATKPPANVLKYGPTPQTQTSFLQNWKQTYQDTFFSYTGRQASGKQIASILRNAPSLYTLAQTLASDPKGTFTTSPTYKAHAPGIIAVAKQAYGQDWKVDKSLVSQAISQNWDQATLEENLRSRPEYFEGPAFKDDKAKMDNVYQGIYGASTDPGTQTVIDHVARNGWTPDQFAAWLRTQPQYRSSQEFKTKAFSFAQQLGLITGKQVTLTEDQAMLGGPPAAPPSAPAPVAPYNPAAYVPGGATVPVGTAIQDEGRKG